LVRLSEGWGAQNATKHMLPDQIQTKITSKTKRETEKKCYDGIHCIPISSKFSNQEPHPKILSLGSLLFSFFEIFQMLQSHGRVWFSLILAVLIEASD
jgi:hypothetical protein